MSASGHDDRARWNRRWTDTDPLAGEASAAVRAVLEGLALPAGPVLDVAAGPGRNAVWLATRGHAVTAMDVSDVAIDLAQRRALSRGVPLITVVADLHTAPFPAGPWALVLVSHYLQRTLWAAAAATLVPGGALVVVHPTVENLARHEKPSRRFLLSSAEARTLAEDAGLRIESYVEGWVGDGDDARHLARLVARR